MIIVREGRIVKLYLGTYTKTLSQGIYTLNFNNGQLSNLELYAKAYNPTYLAWGETPDELVVVAGQPDQGGIALFQAGQKVAEWLSPGGLPCFVSYHNQRYYSAFYHDGKVESYTRIGKVAEMYFPDQAKSHFIQADEAGGLWICNLGEDQLYWLKNAQEAIEFKSEAGQGPRHVVFGLNQTVYVITELSNEILVLKQTANSLKLVETVKLNGATTNQSAAIKISADKRFIYTSTRGEDFISVFKIRPTGGLTFVQQISSFGQHPRDLALSPDGGYLVVANRDSNSLTSFKVDQAEGYLTLLEKDIYVPEVVAVLFEREESK